MRIVRYKYTVYRDTQNPIVPLQVLGKENWKVIWAYVDSGATYSIFSFWEARRLGLEPTKGERIEMVVGNGDRIWVYLFQLKARLENIEFKTVIGFSGQLGSGFNLLGRKNVFENFKICFDDSQGLLTFARGKNREGALPCPRHSRPDQLSQPKAEVRHPGG
jgi:hypothetical protein